MATCGVFRGLQGGLTDLVKRLFATCLALAMAASVALAQDATYYLGDLTIGGAFARATLPRAPLEVLCDYVSWVSGVAGASGSQAEIDKALAAFWVYAK
jgi:hypothetical protein